MLWCTLSMPGMEVPPVARTARMSWRAISRLVHLRASRCRRSRALKPRDMTHRLVGGSPRMSGEQVVGQADLGAVDEGADLAGVQDERGAVRVGGLAEGDPAAGELPGFQAGAAVVA